MAMLAHSIYLLPSLPGPLDSPPAVKTIDSPSPPPVANTSSSDGMATPTWLLDVRSDAISMVCADADGCGWRRCRRWSMDLRHHGCSMVADGGGVGEAWTCDAQTNAKKYPIRLSVTMVARWWRMAAVSVKHGLAPARRMG